MFANQPKKSHFSTLTENWATFISNSLHSCLPTFLKQCQLFVYISKYIVLFGSYLFTFMIPLSAVCLQFGVIVSCLFTFVIPLLVVCLHLFFDINCLFIFMIPMSAVCLQLFFNTLFVYIHGTNFIICYLKVNVVNETF